MKGICILACSRWAVVGAAALTICGSAITLERDREQSKPGILRLADRTRPELGFQQQVGYASRYGDNEEVNNRPKTPEELLEQIRALKESGLYFEGRFPEGDSADEYSKFAFQRLINGEGGVSGSLAAGNLRIYVVRNPEKWDYRTNEINRYLGDFDGLEWIALFKDVLNCPMDNALPAPNKDVTSEDRPYELKFQQAIPDYPMLGRIWNTFEDVVYEPHEIKKLREECLRVKTITAHEQALQGLDKLIAACDDAISNRLGMYLACD